jgi:anti-sigma factor RsiW
MKCEDLLKALGDYVDGGIDAELCEAFESHLAGCQPCQIVVDNMRQTITLYRDGKPYDLPEPFRNRLHANLKAKWKERMGQR